MGSVRGGARRSGGGGTAVRGGGARQLAHAFESYALLTETDGF